jgi:hypothetical protein
MSLLRSLVLDLDLGLDLVVADSQDNRKGHHGEDNNIYLNDANLNNTKDLANQDYAKVDYKNPLPCSYQPLHNPDCCYQQAFHFLVRGRGFGNVRSPITNLNSKKTKVAKNIDKKKSIAPSKRNSDTIVLGKTKNPNYADVAKENNYRNFEIPKKVWNSKEMTSLKNGKQIKNS